jgi:MiaB/RimO family radical SAM methylthiotransferase
MTGCGAEVNPEKMLQSTGVDFVIGNQDKDRFSEIIQKAVLNSGIAKSAPTILGAVTGYSELLSRHPMDREWPAIDQTYLPPIRDIQGESSRTRIFLKIQEGCDSFCTYCIIPYGRGPSRSVRLEDLVRTIQSLKDVKEVVLTGTNIGDYGRDWNLGASCLEELIEKILKQTKLPRLRLSSLNPVEISHRLIQIMRQEKRLMPHFHISLQSPVTKILKRMKRKYTQKEVIQTLESIESIKNERGPIFVGMDVITGFPGETDADFQEGLELLSQLPWTRLHVFPYSEREGTPATKLSGSVPISVRKERARILNQLSQKRIESFYQSQLFHSFSDVLMESEVKGPDGKPGWISGYSGNYMRFLVRSNDTKIYNKIIKLNPYSVVLDRASGEAFFIANL